MAEDVMLEEAIEAIRRGQRVRARDLLTRLLRADQENPQYWLWMSAVVDSRKEQVYCLENVLRLDPANLSARRGLVLFGAARPEEAVKPAPPVRRRWEAALEDAPELHGIRAILGKPLSRAAVIGVAGVLVVGLVLAGIFGLRLGRRSALASRPTKTAGPLPTFTLTPTFVNASPATETPGTKPAGPAPARFMEEVSYTPTPLYVNTPHPVSEAFRIAQRAMERGDWETALSNLEQASQNEPKAGDIPYTMGEVYRLQGMAQEALSSYEQAIDVDPDFAPAYLGRALASWLVNSKADLEQDLNQAIENDPDYGEAYLARARYRLEQGELEGALEDLDQAEDLIPGSPLIYQYRAQLALVQGDEEAALEAALRANELDRRLLESYLTLGQAALLNEQYDQAIEALEIYVAYAPDHARAWVELARAYFEAGGKGNTQKALDAIDQALQIDDRLIEAYYERGQINLALGEGQAAINDLVYAEKNEPGSFPINLDLGRALLLAGRLNEARGQLTSALQLAETDEELVKVYFWRAQVLEKAGNLPAARQDWQALLELPQDGVPKVWAGMARDALKPTATATARYTATPKPSLTPKADTRTATPKVTTVLQQSGTPATPSITPEP